LNTNVVSIDYVCLVAILQAVFWLQVGVKDLKCIGSQCWAMMREGEAEKQKQYVALVWISRPLEEKDFNSISCLKELKILQKTPVRVLHRRSPLDREKIIHWLVIIYREFHILLTLKLSSV
jgi:tRNA U54 and U55 pseudouridine synthase Pus10